MRNRLLHKTSWLALGLTALLAATGCIWSTNAPEAAETQADQAPVERKLSTEGWNKILEAIDKNKTAPHFGIKAEHFTNLRGLSHRSAIYGHISLPDMAVLSQNVDGRAYYLYQDEENTYWRAEDVWQKRDTRIGLPDTWESLDRLKQLTPQQVYQLPDVIIISFPAEVYQFEADAVDIAGIDAPKDKKLPARYTFYVDKKDRWLKRIEIEYTDHLEGAGSVSASARIDYFDFDDKKSAVKMPEQLEKFLEEHGKHQE